MQELEHAKPAAAAAEEKGKVRRLPDIAVTIPLHKRFHTSFCTLSRQSMTNPFWNAQQLKQSHSAPALYNWTSVCPQVQEQHLRKLLELAHSQKQRLGVLQVQQMSCMAPAALTECCPTSNVHKPAIS